MPPNADEESKARHIHDRAAGAAAADRFDAMPEWKKKLYVIIFESDTPAGKAFDVALLVAIFLSVVVVMLESVPVVRARFHDQLIAAEWVLTVLFTLEYVARLLCAPSPLRYARSFFGLIDLLSIIPTYLSLFVLDAHYLIIVRALRLLRVFRIFKLAHFLREGDVLVAALRASRAKITVFLAAVMTTVVVMGTLMYLIEGEEHGFNSIPESVYWAIVTLTTVGYGDIAPETVMGRMVASVIMIMGYGIIAVPTGIFSIELSQAASRAHSKTCPQCNFSESDAEASYCRRCGCRLH
ncbi:MAG: ion transporter [Verrucomicrobiales bacterium]|nr:ion transporter [Verrucomicrobiales bacterium]